MQSPEVVGSVCDQLYSYSSVHCLCCFIFLLSSSSLWIYASVDLSVFDHRLLTNDLKVVLGEVTI